MALVIWYKFYFFVLESFAYWSSQSEYSSLLEDSDHCILYLFLWVLFSGRYHTFFHIHHHSSLYTFIFFIIHLFHIHHINWTCYRKMCCIHSLSYSFGRQVKCHQCRSMNIVLLSSMFWYFAFDWEILQILYNMCYDGMEFEIQFTILKTKVLCLWRKSSINLYCNKCNIPLLTLLPFLPLMHFSIWLFWNRN